jgi:hypothetical protein
MEDMRRAITGGSFNEFYDVTKIAWRNGEASGKLEA